MLYWAYGSNLNVKHMKRRCPDARKVAPLVLNNGALLFRHVADVTARPDSKIPGGLWRISKDDERTLDGYEGVASGLYMKRYLVLEIRGKVEKCLFYQMRTHYGIMPPSDDYIKTIAQGYKDFDLDQTWLEAALAESWEDKSVTDYLHERWNRRGRPRLARLS